MSYYFLHIPKTAGTSTIDWLTRVGGLRACPHQLWGSLLAADRSSLAQYDLFHGHFYTFLPAYLGRRLRTFTFLRDPVARAYSHYRHALRDSAHYFHAQAQSGGSFMAFIQNPLTRPLVSNFQTRSLSAVFDPIALWTVRDQHPEPFWLERHLETAPTGLSEDEALARASAFLDECLFVGFVERMEESVQRLAQVLRISRHMPVASLNSDSTGGETALSEDEQQYARSLNRLDQELYAHALERFGGKGGALPAAARLGPTEGEQREASIAPIVSYAQNFEDVMLWRALHDVDRGFYVDIGAQHPTYLSTSRAFYERGWRGLNVEPAQAYAELLRQERPDESVLAVAVAEREELLAFYEVRDTGLSTADARIAEQHRLSGYDVHERTVPAVTLDTILAQCQVREIHWLKIDVEGFEQQVLAGWTLRAPLPWIVVVESTLPLTTIDTSASWEPALLARGYVFAYFDGLNRFYVAPGHVRLLEAFRAPPNVFDDFALTADSTFARELAARIGALSARIGDAERREAELLERNSELGATLNRTEVALANEQRGRADADASWRDTHAQLQRQMNELRRAYLAIETSRSWRMTRPLRELASAGRRLVARDPASPRERKVRSPLAHHIVIALLAHMNAHPERKRLVVGALSIMPVLARRLRTLAHHAVEVAEPRRRERTDGRAAPSWPGMATAGARELARRMEYIVDLESRLDEADACHRRELERLTREIEALRKRRTAGRTQATTLDVEP